MKIALIGGHLAPALALLDYLPTTWEPIFIGRRYSLEGDLGESLEYTTLTQRTVPFFPLHAGRLQRKLTAQTLPSLIKFPSGYYQALHILRQQHPDVIVGFGGYLSLPVGLAAAALRIPFLIHEQTLRAGLTNRILSRFASRVCISWKSSASYFPRKKTVLTGNLLRRSFLSQVITEKKIRGKEKTIYITGGSAGAHALNLLIEPLLPELLAKYHIIHQTGDAREFGDFDHLSLLKHTLDLPRQKRYSLQKFIPVDEVVNIFSRADMVISRSGINTVTELLLMNKPALLIPLPYGQQNEQIMNAIYLHEAGLGRILLQNHTTPQVLGKEIDKMIENLEKFVVGKDIDVSIHMHAVSTMIQLIESVYEEKSGKKS